MRFLPESTIHLLPSTAERYRKEPLTQNYSGMKKVHSPVLWIVAKAILKRLVVVLFSWMKLGKCPWGRRPGYFVFWKVENLSGLDQAKYKRLTSASSLPP